jgi:hypothetical protein
MRLRKLLSCISVCLVNAALWAASPVAPTTDFTISNPSHIPGATLQPGTYSIRVVNRLSDRVILKVDAANGSVHSMFIGIPNDRIEKPTGSGAVKWANSPDGTTYIKGWYFPGSSSVVEFVYPKADAVALATSNPSKVPAVDPASEGKVTDNTLSQNDMQLLTLWLLSLEEVGPGGTAPSIKAARYETASMSQKPAIKALPHTASWLPWMWLTALCSLIAAGTLRIAALQNATSAVGERQSLRE